MPEVPVVSTVKNNFANAVDMAAHQRDISIAEFFLKNRHLLGFDSPSKALVTAVKEAVDNALDACEEAGILPELMVQVGRWNDNFRVIVEDNGPGILPEQIGRIFGKLLYGSKFHKLSQSRGQQGMGISAAGMYGQLTAGTPMKIISRVAGESRAMQMYVAIDTSRNRPDMHRKQQVEWECPHGTHIEIEMEGHYQTGSHSVPMYLKLTAIANPHVSISYRDPHHTDTRLERSITQLPPLPSVIKPHPHGVELGRLIQMLSDSRCRSLQSFLVEEFSRVGRNTAIRIIDNAGRGLSPRSLPKRIAHAQAAALHRAIQRTAISSPRTDCLVPIGEVQLLEGLRKQLEADFYTVLTRPAAVYRGNPFQVEVGLAYAQAGGLALQLEADGRIHRHTSQAVGAGVRADAPVRLLRFANRVPLLYQQSACAITRAAIQVNWRNYGLQQPKGALPLGPMVVLVHVASVWVPYTSESKEAIAAYDEIIKEIQLGLQACGRRLAHYLSHEKQLRREYQHRQRLASYLPHIGGALQDILGLSDEEREATEQRLDEAIIEHRRI